MRLTGKVAVVTGAGQGIGRAVALTLGREGAAVAVSDIELGKADKVAQEIKTLGGQALALQADVSAIKDVDSLIERTVATFRQLDILVNNVGGEVIVPSIDVSESQWDMVMSTGVKATFFCCQRFAREILKQGSPRRAKIVNIASVGGHVGTPSYAAYGASKASIIQLTKALGVEWIRHNINVNAVSPGVTLTPRVEKATLEHPEFFRPYFDRIPARHPAEPQQIADAVLFLASSDADHVVGQVLAVDGGILALHPGYVWPQAAEPA